MSETVSVFRGKYGEVWRTGDDYGTLGAGHAFCVEMAKEIEKLREQLAAAQKHAEVGEAIERAARELPEGWEISIRLERESGTVNLFDTDGSLVQFATDDYALSDTINDAVKWAKENG